MVRQQAQELKARERGACSQPRQQGLRFALPLRGQPFSGRGTMIRNPFVKAWVLLLFVGFSQVPQPAWCSDEVSFEWTEVHEVVDGYPSSPTLSPGSGPETLEVLLDGTPFFEAVDKPSQPPFANSPCKIDSQSVVDVFPSRTDKTVLLELPGKGFRRIYRFWGDPSLVSSTLPSTCFALGGRQLVRSRVRIQGSGNTIGSVLLSILPTGHVELIDEYKFAVAALQLFRDSGWKIWTKGGDFAAGTLVYEKRAWLEDYSRGGILRLQFILAGNHLNLERFQVVNEETLEPDSFGWLPPPECPSDTETGTGATDETY